MTPARTTTGASGRRLAFVLLLATSTLVVAQDGPTQVGKVAIPPGTKIPAADAPEIEHPLDGVLGEFGREENEATWKQHALDIARRIPRKKVPDLVRAHPSSDVLKVELDRGRQAVTRDLLQGAVKLANSDLQTQQRAPLMRLLSVNSGSGDDYTRDNDVTLFGGDKVREVALFKALERKAADLGLSVSRNSGGITIDQLEVTFFPSHGDLPDARYAESPQRHIRKYREALQKQRANPEAYMGAGWKQEVLLRRDPATANVMEFTFAPDSKEVLFQGHLPKSGAELRELFRGNAERRLKKWELSSALVSPLKQAMLHGKDPGGDPTKGPIKYAARSLDRICEYYDFPAWDKLSPDDRMEVVLRVCPQYDLKNPTHEKIVRKYVGALNAASKIRKTESTTLPKERVRRLETICTNFLARSVAATVPETAAAMLRPPPLPRGDDSYTRDELARIDDLRRQGKYGDIANLRRRKEADFRFMTSHEAMEDLLMTVVEVRGLDIDADGKHVGRKGAAAMKQMMAGAPKHLRPVMQLAGEYGVLFNATLTANDPKVVADTMQRLYDIRVEMRKLMEVARTSGEDVEARLSKMSPGAFIGQETKRPRSALGDAGEGMEKRLRRRLEDGLPDADRARQRMDSSDTAAPRPSYMRQRLHDEVFQLDNIADCLTLLEMYQGSATGWDYAQFFAENIFGRLHWGASHLVGALKANNEEDVRRLGHGIVFATAARWVPGIGQVKVVFDIAQGTLNVTVGYVIGGENAETIDAIYIGDRLLGPVDQKVVGSGTVAAARRESGFKVIEDHYFREIRPEGAEIDHRIIDRAALYRDRFRKWTSLEWDGFSMDGFRREQLDAFAEAHDALAYLLLEEAGKTGPLWIPRPTRRIDQVVKDVAGWKEPSEALYKLYTERFFPLLLERCRADVLEVLDESAARTYRDIYTAAGKDVIEEGVTQRLATDILAGMTDAWRLRATEQMLARRQVQRAAMYEDLSALAENVRKEAFAPKQSPRPPQARLDVRVDGAREGWDETLEALGTTMGEVAEGAVAVFDAALPLLFEPELVPADTDEDTSTLEVVTDEEKVTVVERAPDAPDDGTVGPGDRLRHEVTFAVRDRVTGEEVDRKKVVYDVRLPQDEPDAPGSLPLLRVEDVHHETRVWTHIDVSSLQARPWSRSDEWALHRDADEVVVPAGWRWRPEMGVAHGEARTTTNEGTPIREGNYRFGHKHGEWRYYGGDGEIREIRSYEMGRLHGPLTEFFDTSDDAYRESAPAAGTVVTEYARGLATSVVATGVDGRVLARARLELRAGSPDLDDDSESYPDAFYAGHVEVVAAEREEWFRGPFVQLTYEEEEALDDAGRDALYDSFDWPCGLVSGSFYPDGAWERRMAVFAFGYLEEHFAAKGGVLNGKYESFDGDGGPFARGQYRDGRRVGEWDWFYKSGRRRYRTEFGPDGEPTGTWLEWSDWEDAKPTEMSRDAIDEFDFNLYRGRR